jgi:TnpA family transposase
MNDPTITKSLEEVGNVAKGIIILNYFLKHTTKRNIRKQQIV